MKEGVSAEFEKCIKCGESLLLAENEVMGAYYEIGGYCDNKECERYLLLVV